MSIIGQKQIETLQKEASDSLIEMKALYNKMHSFIISMKSEESIEANQKSQIGTQILLLRKLKVKVEQLFNAIANQHSINVLYLNYMSEMCPSETQSFHHSSLTDLNPSQIIANRIFPNLNSFQLLFNLDEINRQLNDVIIFRQQNQIAYNQLNKNCLNEQKFSLQSESILFIFSQSLFTVCLEFDVYNEHVYYVRDIKFSNMLEISRDNFKMKKSDNNLSYYAKKWENQDDQHIELIQYAKYIIKFPIFRSQNVLFKYISNKLLKENFQLNNHIELKDLIINHAYQYSLLVQQLEIKCDLCKEYMQLHQNSIGMIPPTNNSDKIDFQMSSLNSNIQEELDESIISNSIKEIKDETNVNTNIETSKQNSNQKSQPETKSNVVEVQIAKRKYKLLTQNEIHNKSKDEQIELFSLKLKEAEKEIYDLTMLNKKLSASNIIQNYNGGRSEQAMQMQIEELKDSLQHLTLRNSDLLNEIRFVQNNYTKVVLSNYNKQNKHQHKLTNKINLHFEFSSVLNACHVGFTTSILSFQERTYCQTLLVSAGQDGFVKIWDIVSQTIVHELKAHESGVECLIYLDDSYSLATGGLDGIVKIWNIANNYKLSTQITGNNNPIRCLAYSEFSKIIILATGKCIKLWSVNMKKFIHIFNLCKYEIWAIEFIDSKSIIYSGGQKGGFNCWNIETLKEETTGIVSKIQSQLAYQICSIKYLQPYNLLSIVQKGQTINCFDLSTGDCVRSFHDHTNTQLSSILYLQHNDCLLSCGTNGTINFWNVGLNKQIQQHIVSNATLKNINLLIKPSGFIHYNAECDFLAVATMDKNIAFFINI